MCDRAPTAAARPTRTAGLRLFPRDVVALALGAAATAALWTRLPGLAATIPLVLGHFFLFCNVVRLRRSYELVWAGTFLAQALAWIALTGALEAWPALAVQTPLTALLVALEARSPRYHGVFSRRLNPQLDRWLAGGEA